MKKLFFAILAIFLSVSATADELGNLVRTSIIKQETIQWVIDSAVLPKRAKLPYHKAKLYVDTAYEVGEQYNIDPKLLLGMIYQESRFNEKARSAYGAVGLMQVVPRWHRKRFTNSNYTDPEQNIHAGAQYLRELLDQKKSMQSAVRYYSGGASGYYTKIHSHRGKLIAHLDQRVILPKSANYDAIAMFMRTNRNF